MNSLFSKISRGLSWLSTDHLAVGVSAFYGTYIWVFHSFAASSAFGALSAGITAQGIPPEPIFAVPLLLGALLHGLGVRRESHSLMLLGSLLSFAVFAAALVSCLMSAATSTGVPAYTGYCLAYAVLTLRHATRNQWVPLA